MIFVTVGSTLFEFNRLFISIDKALAELDISERLIVQARNSNYKWKYKNVYPYKYLEPNKINILFSKANRIITHGGPGTIFLLANRAKKMPLIIARSSKYGEHVNDHQVDYISYLRSLLPSRYRNFLIDEENILVRIKKYIKSNNKKNVLSRYFFNSKNKIGNHLEKYIKDL